MKNLSGITTAKGWVCEVRGSCGYSHMWFSCFFHSDLQELSNQKEMEWLTVGTSWVEQHCGTVLLTQVDRMSEDMPDRMSEDMQNRMSEDMPDGMPDIMPDRMSEDIPDRMPDRMSEDMPDRIQNRMPNRMPEDLPARMSDGMN